MEKEAIERSDVEELAHVRATDRIFDMIEYMATKRKDDALKLYYDLLELKESPLRILNMLERQFRLLIAVKDLKSRGLNKNQIADKLQIKPFVADKCIGQAGHFSMGELKKALKDAAEFENAAKSGGILDRMAVEMLLISNAIE
jgi:DNA polymerase-3 subunit delta